MAGKLRMKVVPATESESFHMEPFWMFVDREESPLIFNIEEEIEKRFEQQKLSVKVQSLYLDGCLLPANETSELLRDNDVVHVNVTGQEDEADGITFPQSKKQRKRKHSDVSPPDVKKKKHNKDKLNDASKPHKDKKEKEKAKKKVVAKQQPGDAVDNDDELSVPAPTATNNTSETQNGISSSQIPPVTEETSKLAGLMNSTPETETSVEKRKRRRRQKKKANAKNQPDIRKEPTTSLDATKQAPAQLRVPKWQQNQNTKIVFYSDEESGAEASVNPDNTQKGEGESQDASSLPSAQPRVSDNNSSFSECFPTSGPLNLPKVDLVQRVVSSKGDVTANQVPDMSMPEEESVGTMNNPLEIENGVNGDDDDWYRDQQYQEKLNEEMCMKRPIPSALDKALNPVRLFERGHHQIVQPNLAEYLKMSPEERGVTVPPGVTARRLSNGAMLYIRSSPKAAANHKTASSTFKKPAIYSPARGSPLTESSQQQLESASPSSPDVRVTEMEVIGGGSSLTEEEPKVMDDPKTTKVPEMTDIAETVVLTPVREYSLFADLTTSPKVGDIIAYKVLEMGEDYAPGISDYKEAEVLAYDASSQNVTVRLSQRRSKKKALGKFDLPEEEPFENEITLELSSMFEPKLISSH